MKTDRIISALIGLSVAMQAAILYRQGGLSGPSRPQPVWDAPEGTVLDISGMPAQGSPDAPLVLIEFSDYECPFCKRHATTVRAELKEKFVDTGQLRYVFANHPLPMHTNAVLLATAAICAGDQGLYWEMHDKLFETGITAREGLRTLIPGGRIETESFDACLEAEMPLELIERDVQIAEALGLNGTPGFALGTIGSSGEVLVAALIQGAQPLTVFEASIDEIAIDGGPR